MRPAKGPTSFKKGASQADSRFLSRYRRGSPRGASGRKTQELSNLSEGREASEVGGGGRGGPKTETRGLVRLPAAGVARAVKALELSGDYEGLKQLILEMPTIRTMHCRVHGRHCPVPETNIHTCGIPCIDKSPMGLRRGATGPTAKVHSGENWRNGRGGRGAEGSSRSNGVGGSGGRRRSRRRGGGGRRSWTARTQTWART